MLVVLSLLYYAMGWLTGADQAEDWLRPQGLLPPGHSAEQFPAVETVRTGVRTWGKQRI